MKKARQMVKKEAEHDQQSEQEQIVKEESAQQEDEVKAEIIEIDDELDAVEADVAQEVGTVKHEIEKEGEEGVKAQVRQEEGTEEHEIEKNTEENPYLNPNLAANLDSEEKWDEIVMNDGYVDASELAPESSDGDVDASGLAPRQIPSVELAESKNQWLKRQPWYDIVAERQRQVEKRNRRTGRFFRRISEPSCA